MTKSRVYPHPSSNPISSSLIIPSADPSFHPPPIPYHPRAHLHSKAPLFATPHAINSPASRTQPIALTSGSQALRSSSFDPPSPQILSTPSSSPKFNCSNAQKSGMTESGVEVLAWWGGWVRETEILEKVVVGMAVQDGGGGDDGKIDTYVLMIWVGCDRFDSR